MHIDKKNLAKENAASMTHTHRRACARILTYFVSIGAIDITREFPKNFTIKNHVKNVKIER